MKKFLWWLFFIAIQIVNAPLLIMGLFICLYPPFAKWTRLWWNNDDPPDISLSWWKSYYWLVIRNPVANFRRIPFVSGPGRPMLYHWWTKTPDDIHSGHYIKIGWESGPPYYPVFQPFFSAGRGY